MTNLTEEPKPDNTTQNGDDLDDILKRYNKPASLDEPENITIKPTTPEQQSTEKTKEQSVEWRGNPAYYQRGEKAGTLKPGYKPKEDIEIISGSFIDGAMFLMLIDLLLPFLIMSANNSFTKSKIDTSDLEMSESQKQKLVPLVDKVMARMSIKASPEACLAISLLSIYGVNFFTARMLAAKPKKNEQTSDNS